MAWQWKRPVYVALIAALVSCGTLLAAGSATAAPQSAQIVVYGYQNGAAIMTVGIDIPKSVDTQARAGKKDWGIDVTVSYVDTNNVVQTIDSGRLSVANDTQFLQSVDGNTDLIQVTLNMPPTAPGPGASFTGTATLIKP